MTDVKFGPRHLGLLLATCSADGTVRIYEAPDVMNLGQWSLQHEIQCNLPCSCLSWNLSMFKSHTPIIAVGSDDSTTHGPKVFVYEFNETGRRWVRVESIMTISDAVHDIAFAPNIGRSYLVLAAATNKDLRIISMKNSEEPAVTNSKRGENEVSSKYQVRLAGHYNDHGSTVWRVCWNVTGTILATSGDDGQVRLWKANYLDDWKCVAVLRGDGQGGHSIPIAPSIFAQKPKFLAQ